MIREIKTRQLRVADKKYFLSTNTFKEGDSWFNCLYLHFAKEDFPGLTYPKLVDCEYGSKKRYSYSDTDLSNHIDWHGGCTFYEEAFYPELGKTLVKVGCDYQHYRDDDYMSGDYGQCIIEIDGEAIAIDFEKLCELRKKSKGE